MELYNTNLIFESSEILFVVATVVAVSAIFVIVKLLARYKTVDSSTRNKNHPQRNRSLKKYFERKMSSQSVSVGALSPSPSFLKCSRMKEHDSVGSPSGFITYSHPCYNSKYASEGSLNAEDGKDSDTGANLELDKLQIGSPAKGGYNNNVHHVSRVSSSAVTSTSYPGDDSVPLWKDYPMVHKGVPSSYSYCSMPMSSYSNSMLSPPSVFRNYRSSSMATIFGGPKPLISPPKLDIGFTPSLCSRPESYSTASPPPTYSCYAGQRQTWAYGSPAENLMPIYLTTPLSRSSSQSSGFISQKGFYTPPPSTVNYSTVPIATHPPRDPEGLSFYPESFIGTCSPRPQVQNFQTDSFASFSSLSNYKSYSPHGFSGNHGHQTWPASAFTERSMGPVSMSVASGSGRSLNGNTCSRFARKDDETKCNPKRSSDVRPTASPLFSEDEDEIGDDVSFKSAVTSMTRFSKSLSGGTSTDGLSKNSRLPRSKSKIRSSPLIRNLRAASLLSGSKIPERLSEGEDNDEADEIVDGANEQSSKSSCYNVWPLLWSVFWNLSLLLNIIIIFWVFFGYQFDAHESHWVHRFVQDVTSEVVTNTLIFRDYFHRTFLELLAAREIHNVSHGNPSVFVLHNEEL